MINRDNYKHVEDYLTYCKQVLGHAKSTQNATRAQLKNLLNWLQEQPLAQAANVRPTLPHYVANKRHKNKPLSRSYQKDILGSTSRCLDYLIDIEIISLPRRYMRTLRVLPSVVDNFEPQIPVEVETAEKIASLNTYCVKERRLQAGMCLMFLTGVRISALMTLPIHAVDLTKLHVIQDPKIGVRTKGGKSGITPILNIPKLLDPIYKWHQELLNASPCCELWIPPLVPHTGKIAVETKLYEVGKHRGHNYRRQMKEWLQSNGLEYQNPHEFRHGFTKFAKSKAASPSDIEAVSRALLHSSVQMTNHYGRMNDREAVQQVHGLINPSNTVQQLELPTDPAELAAILERVIKLLRG